MVVRGLGVIRDGGWLVFAAATTTQIQVLSPVHGEALSLRWAMALAIDDLGFWAVCFETDCFQLFEMWRKTGRGRS